MPKNVEEWKQISNNFKTLWNFENCLRSIYSKHRLITKPPNSGLFYYNYNGIFSVILCDTVNANYVFIYVHYGTNGRVLSDDGILKETDFYRSLINDNLQIPDSQCPAQVKYGLTYVFIEDEAFLLMENMMKLYSKHCVGHDEQIFNYQLPRARRVVGNSFGI